MSEVERLTAACERYEAVHAQALAHQREVRADPKSSAGDRLRAQRAVDAAAADVEAARGHLAIAQQAERRANLTILRTRTDDDEPFETPKMRAQTERYEILIGLYAHSRHRSIHALVTEYRQAAGISEKAAYRDIMAMRRGLPKEQLRLWVKELLETSAAVARDACADKDMSVRLEGGRLALAVSDRATKLLGVGNVVAPDEQVTEGASVAELRDKLEANRAARAARGS